MIQYSANSGIFTLLSKVEGSVLPKSLKWATSAGINAGVVYYIWYHLLEEDAYDEGTAVSLMGSFTFILGFLVVFRTQQAYSRYWEGATLVQQARANFFNSCSSLIAFCTAKKELQPQVEEFQHLLVRLVSMLQCVGLQTVADYQDVRFEFFNTDGIDEESLNFLRGRKNKNQRCEIIAQWIQRLMVSAESSGIIDVPAPILTRAYQELSNGLIHIINARNMTSIPFPFPYAQMLAALLVIHWMVTPIFCALMMKSAIWSSTFCFLVVLAFWGTNYIAAEIESPFGDDPNDLPLFALQKDMNTSLWVLLNPIAQQVPYFKFDKDAHRKWDVVTEKQLSVGASSLKPPPRHSLWSHKGSFISRQSSLISTEKESSKKSSLHTAGNTSLYTTGHGTQANSARSARKSHLSGQSSPGQDFVVCLPSFKEDDQENTQYEIRVQTPEGIPQIRIWPSEDNDLVIVPATERQSPAPPEAINEIFGLPDCLGSIAPNLRPDTTKSIPGSRKNKEKSRGTDHTSKRDRREGPVTPRDSSGVECARI